MWYLLFLFWGALPLTALAEGVAGHCPPESVILDEYILRVSTEHVGRSKTTIDLSQSIAKLSEDLRPLRSGFVDERTSSLVHHAKTRTKISLQPRPYLIKATPANLAQIRTLPGVVDVEANCAIYETQNTPIVTSPNDPLLSQNWSLESIDLPRAWQQARDASDVVVAIIDTGIDTVHPDLAPNIWINELEANGTAGVDDDGNGYIDDIQGYDFSGQDGDPTPGTWMGAEHGTHVAGIVGAVGNNGIGTAGVAWNVQLMPLKVFPDDHSRASLADLVQAIYYAVDNGAKVINASLSARKAVSTVEKEAYAYAEEAGVAVVVASGNNASNGRHYSPGSIESVISVGSVNSEDALSSFSNYGKSVDILGPGGDSEESGGLEEYVVSTFPESSGSYGGLKGTSMAAPYVSGTIALLKSAQPTLSLKQLKKVLIDGADIINIYDKGASNQTSQYRRLNVAKSLKLLTIDNTCKPTDQCDIPVEKLQNEVSLARLGPSPGCDFSARELPLDQKASGNFFYLLFLPFLLGLLKRLRD